MCVFGFRLPQFKEELKSGVVTNIRKVGSKLLNYCTSYSRPVSIHNSLEDDHKIVEKTLHLIFLLWSLLFLAFFSGCQTLLRFFAFLKYPF